MVYLMLFWKFQLFSKHFFGNEYLALIIQMILEGDTSRIFNLLIWSLVCCADAL